jgi:class 3 adenylate cyclase
VQRETHYAKSGPVSIAYQVVGEGPTDLILVPGFVSHVEVAWEEPRLAHFLSRLAAFSRLIVFDKRGTGMSDPVASPPSMDERMDDIRAVMDAAGSERAVLWSGSNATGIGVLFAATYPERCAGLVLFDPRIMGTRSAEYPWAMSADEWPKHLADIRARWGSRSYFEELAREWAPEVTGDPAFVEWFVEHMRRSLSPGAALTAYRTAMELDVRDVLAAVHVPTLILPRPAQPGPGHYTAARIRGSEVIELPPLRGVYTWVDHAAHQATMDATAGFISRLRTGRQAERVLATVLFTDIVGSTELAGRLGDTAWRELLERHHAIVRRELARFHGRELDTAGDGFFASFDGPARAVQAAAALREPLGAIGLEIRAGLHTGEFEVSDGKIVGIAVSIGARISSLAGPGEVLVSSTVKDLVAGSGLGFADRGEHQLKGIPEAWHLFALAA